MTICFSKHAPGGQSISTNSCLESHPTGSQLTSSEHVSKADMEPLFCKILNYASKIDNKPLLPLQLTQNMILQLISIHSRSHINTT